MNNLTPPPVPSQSQSQTRSETDGLAIASIILGILSVLGAAMLIVPTVLAIVFGHISISKINKNPNLQGRGLAITGLITGYFSVVFIIIGMFAAMAIPAFQKVRDNSLTKTMLNDARQLGMGSEQALLSNSKYPLTFSCDPATGEIQGPIKIYVSRISRGMEIVDGTITDESDTFSLRNPHVNHGDPVVFTLEGKPVTEIK